MICLRLEALSVIFPSISRLSQAAISRKRSKGRLSGFAVESAMGLLRLPLFQWPMISGVI